MEFTYSDSPLSSDIKCARGTRAALDSMAEYQGNQAADQTSEDQTITNDPHRCPDQTSGRMELPEELRNPRSNRTKSKEHKRLNTHKLVLQYIVPCINSYGLCLVDNFLGDRIGERVVQEVKRIHQSGNMQEGQLVSQKLNKSKAIRGDKIAWVDGTDSGCQNIGYLLTRMDKLITCADGKLDRFKIRGRHKVSVVRALYLIDLLLEFPKHPNMTSLKQSVFFGNRPLMQAVACFNLQHKIFVLKRLSVAMQSFQADHKR